MSDRMLRITLYLMIAMLTIAFLGALDQRDEAREEVNALAAEIVEMQDNPYVLVIERGDTYNPSGADGATSPCTGAAYTEEDVELLARVIFMEMGSDAHPNTELYCVGSVVLNRIASKNYPNTLREVVYQTKPQAQYGPAVRGELEGVEPTPRCYRIAEDLLRNGSRLPPAVVGQSEEAWGPIFRTYTSPVTGETIIYWMEEEP